MWRMRKGLAKMTTQTKAKDGYTMLQDNEGNFAIVAVDEKGAHWVVRPDALFFKYEVEEIWERLTHKL